MNLDGYILMSTRKPHLMIVDACPKQRFTIRVYARPAHMTQSSSPWTGLFTTSGPLAHAVYDFLKKEKTLL